MDIVIQTPGASLRVENNNFIMTLLDQQYSVPPHHVRTITVGKGASLSSDAVMKAIEHEIDIIFVDALGNPLGRIWSPKYGSISTIRIHQTEFVFSRQATGLIQEILARKLDASMAILLYLASLDESQQSYVERAITALQDYKNKILSIPPDIITEVASTIRGWEGLASKKYFDTIRRFIPPYLNFTKRGSPPAKDPVNALLNYLYGILYSKIESALIKAGIDPYLGIYHRNDYNRPSLAFDIIEQYRAWAEYVVFNLALQNAIDPDTFFIVQEDGSYWLDSLGKRVALQAFSDYLSEVVVLENLSRSREEHIQLFAHRLAQQILNFKKNG